MESFNIVEFIEHNPLAKLSDKYNNRLLCKIIESFGDFEQKLFVSSFYCYLNYNTSSDFVVDLDNVWKWLGFDSKRNAERVLVKHFKLNDDFNYNSAEENLACQVGQASYGGHNIKKIFLTVKTFKLLCLKAQTSKSSEVHEYYLKLEEVLQQVVEEENSELKRQLTMIKDDIEVEKEELKREKRKAVEAAIVEQFPTNTECIYFGTIDNTSEEKETLVKFGQTNDLHLRVLDHRKVYNNFILVDAFRVQNKVAMEKLIKAYPKIKKHIRKVEVNGMVKTELIAYDQTNFTLTRLSYHIKTVIHSKTYSIENFNRLLKENENLVKANVELVRAMDQQALLKTDLESKVTKVVVENEALKEKIQEYQKKEQLMKEENQSVYEIATSPEDELSKKFKEFIGTICIVRPEVAELSVNLEGRYRLWSQEKPSKEVYHALKDYLDTKFKPKRIGGNHGYVGIKLKTVEYKKISESGTSDVETFIFQKCQFSDCGKVLNRVLLTEYQKWKFSVGKMLTEKDMKEVKDYLDLSPYALRATVWTDQGNNQGFYGLCLKSSMEKPKLLSSTGKKIEKRDRDNNILGKWDTIAQAALVENVSAAKMSRSVKGKTMFGDCYYVASS